MYECTIMHSFHISITHKFIFRLETEGREGPESMKNALDAANKELASLRDARIRTEDMVLGLVQQRDMYRAMVNFITSLLVQ